MKVLLVVLMMVFTGWFARAVEVSDKLVNVLIKVESKGKLNAIGDNGKAKGCLQIWDVVLIDVNKVSKRKFTREDCFNKEKSKQICKIYLTHYGKVYEKRMGKKADEEVLARIWNGGPKGYAKVSTIKYWNKVIALI